MQSFKDALSGSSKIPDVKKVTIGECPDCRNGKMPNGQPERKRQLQKLVYADGTEKIIPCICHKEREVQASQRLINASKIDSYSVIDEEYKNASWDHLELKSEQQQKAYVTVTNYIENLEENIKKGRGLLFQGSYGTGKTYISAIVRRAVLKTGHSVLFISFPEYFQRMADKQKTFKQDDKIIDIASDADLLILDEVNADLNTWQQTELYRLVDRRKGKSTIYTTNYKSDDFRKDVKLAQSFSRMMANKDIVLLNGTDYRIKGAF